MILTKLRKIGLIGRVDFSGQLMDGQTVKTRAMFRLLCEMYGKDSIILVETKDYKKRALKVMLDTFKCMLFCKEVFVLLSENGMRFFFPILHAFAKFKKIRVYHNLIGAWLGHQLEKYPQWIKYLNSFQINWVESRNLVQELASKGISKVEYLPNFKYLKKNNSVVVNLVSEFRFCLFSRVTEEKGIGDAAVAIERIAATCNTTNVVLDIYGPVDPNYKSEFKSILASCTHVRYCGCVSPEKSVFVISAYNALLFPTKWKGEGIPGTIIDAFYAGVPIIASRWICYDEMLEDGITGFGYEYGRQDLLEPCIRRFMALSKNEVCEMKKSCLRRADNYSPEVVKAEIRKVMGR